MSAKPDPHESELFPDLDAAGALRAAFRSRDSPAPDLRRASATVVVRGEQRRGYELHEEIARGGMGVIIKAFDRGLGREVALKMLRDEMSHQPRFVHRFLEEASITARLDHPGVIPVHEVGRDTANRDYFAMRLVRGRDLLQIIELANANQEGWNQARCLTVILRVCEAMAYAHDKGILHRDLKPSNVMVGAFGEVYVMDWGLARVIGHDDSRDLRLRELVDVEGGSDGDERANVESPIVTMDGEILGTPCYMPPEQALGRVAELGPRSDVYSVGAMLYHLLGGVMPYSQRGKSIPARAVLKRVAASPPRPLHELRQGLPAELVAICETAMARDPAQRYASMLAMAEDLRAFLETRVVQAYQTGAFAELSKWVQRNKALSVASGAAVLALVLGLVASLVLKKQSDDNATLAQINATTAQQQEKVATARADDVLRLSALQDLDDLAAEAQQLWPAEPAMVPQYEAWMARAQAALDELPAHEARLVELRARALPWSAEPDPEARERHPRFTELVASRRRVDRQRRQFAALESTGTWWAAGPEDAVVDPESLPATWKEANDLAWPLVDPAREKDGEEVRGLALAQRAVELAASLSPSVRASPLDTLAWAFFANGRFDEALDAEKRALDDVEFERFYRYERSLKDLEHSIQGAAGPDRREKQRLWLAELEARVAAIEDEVMGRTEWSFADTQDKWWHNQLTKLIAGLESLVGLEHGLLSPSGFSPEHGWSIGKRLEFARTIAARSVSSPEAAASWSQALASIRDRAECPKYDGLTLAPQLGLLPIGRDPDSGLWEFAHLATGQPAERGADGKLVLREKTGLVFVLIPGGTFQMGAQRGDPDGANYDPQAYENESSVHAVTLPPYFFSKFEMTQGQWLALTGADPSHYGLAYFLASWSRPPPRGMRLHPVEQVNWATCVTSLGRARLDLPTEAQWEYGCRGGTSTVWWCGTDPGSLQDVANLMDAYGRDHGNENWKELEEWLDDGQTAHGEVGLNRANGFGLHDVHGNVMEWCKGWLNDYDVAPGGGNDETIPGRRRALRGGSFASMAIEARSATREAVQPEAAGANLGVRPVMNVSN